MTLPRRNPCKGDKDHAISYLCWQDAYNFIRLPETKELSGSSWRHQHVWVREGMFFDLLLKRGIEASSQWISMNVLMSRMRRKRALHQCITSASSATMLSTREIGFQGQSASNDSLDQVKLSSSTTKPQPRVTRYRNSPYLQVATGVTSPKCHRDIYSR